MRLGVLGPLRVARDGTEVDLGPDKQRTLLAGLLLTPNRVVPTDHLVDLLWGDRPPAAVTASPHGYVAGLRRALEPARPARSRPEVLLTSALGYTIQVEEDAVDAAEFAAVATGAHRSLAGPERFGVPVDRPAPELIEIADRLEAMLGLWRGVAYAELSEASPAVAERTRLDELRAHAIHDLGRVLLALDRPGDAASLLGPLTDLNPLREDIRGRYILALARAGRQSEALEQLQDVRTRLADELGTGMDPEVTDRFQQFEAITSHLVAASERRPIMVLLDDLQWADHSSLRLLRHLLTSATSGRLLIVLTRRTGPPAHGALADVIETLARRSALRLDLPGLRVEQITELAENAGHGGLDEATARALYERTEGNPFFLGELLRLAADGGLNGDAVPAAVSDVVLVRVGQLDEPVRRMLRVASVLGRTPDLTVLAGLLDTDPTEVVDHLDTAVTAGLLAADPGPVRFRHALVRDAVYAAVPPWRRQQWHARAATLLTPTDMPERRAEIAAHWRRAGPAYVAQAWRSAAAAAAYAVDLQAYTEAAELLETALASQAEDAAATPVERYNLLLARADACRRAADTDGQTAAARAAAGIADDLGDLSRLAEAAIAGAEGGLWSNQPSGSVDHQAIAMLRRAALELPDDEGTLRCRAFLALSRELYWAPQPEECWAYAEQGLAIARRLDDQGLVSAACRTAFMALYRPDTRPLRIALAAEVVLAARSAGDAEGEIVGLFWQALAAGEGGLMVERRDAVDQAMRLAERHRLRYLQVMIGTYEVDWLALEDRLDEADRLLVSCERWSEHASFPFRDEALAGARITMELWRGRSADILPGLVAVADASPVDMGNVIVLLLLRAGQVDQAREHVKRRPLPVTENRWDTLSDAAIMAEAALLLGRPDLGATAYRVLRPWADRMVSAGTGLPLGPVEAFLALAAATVGETALAKGHADRAATLCAAWRQPAVARWLARTRQQFGF